MTQILIFTHDLRDRLDCRKRVLDFVCNCCCHPSERRQTFAFRQFPFKAHVLLHQARVVDGNCNLISQCGDYRTNVRSQTSTYGVDGEQACHLLLSPHWICELESMFIKQWLIFNWNPAASTRLFKNLFYPRLTVWIIRNKYLESSLKKELPLFFFFSNNKKKKK